MKRIKFNGTFLAAIITGSNIFLASATPTLRFANYTFFNLDQTGSPNVMTKSQWHYRPLGGCSAASSNTSCDVIYSQITIPSVNNIPSSTAVFVSGGATGIQWDGN